MIDIVLAKAKVYRVHQVKEDLVVSSLKISHAGEGTIGGNLEVPFILPFGKTFNVVLTDPDHRPVTEATGRKFQD